MTLELGYREFKEIRDIVYQKCGIYINDEQLYITNLKLQERLKALGMDDFRKYLKYLKFLDKDKSELNELIQSITVNETYFFREFPQLQTFAEYCIPELIENGNRTFKVLSAGCSNGAEPYTLAIILREMLEDDFSYWVDAIDIDDGVLRQAVKGVYQERDVRNVPSKYLEKYFFKDGNSYVLNSEIKRFVKFYKLNLMDTDNMLRLGQNYDFIFCRNVLIYFSDISKKDVIQTFYRMLVPGGFLFLSQVESLARISTSFNTRRINNVVIYQKPIGMVMTNEL